MDRVATFFVLLSAAAYGGIGVWILVDPVGAMGGVNVVPDDVIGVIELRAMYGGLELGMALFLLLCLRRGWIEAGVWAATLSFGGLGLVRGVGWLAAGMPASLHPWLLVAEVGTVLLGVAVLVAGRGQAGRDTEVP